MSINRRRALLAVVKLAALAATVVIGYLAGTAWAHHQYGLVTLSATRPALHLVASSVL